MTAPRSEEIYEAVLSALTEYGAAQNPGAVPVPAQPPINPMMKNSVLDALTAYGAAQAGGAGATLPTYRAWIDADQYAGGVSKTLALVREAYLQGATFASLNAGRVQMLRAGVYLLIIRAFIDVGAGTLPGQPTLLTVSSSVPPFLISQAQAGTVTGGQQQIEVVRALTLASGEIISVSAYQGSAPSVGFIANGGDYGLTGVELIQLG